MSIYENSLPLRKVRVKAMKPQFPPQIFWHLFQPPCVYYGILKYGPGNEYDATIKEQLFLIIGLYNV
eukprot:snap_masked-scaffold_4-processed-gene-4.17-mRNA-1 protein AED:1.00 eAED:1.00 QI:0/-1/0/0/-1/1/1/0/66